MSSKRILPTTQGCILALRALTRSNRLSLHGNTCALSYFRTGNNIQNDLGSRADMNKVAKGFMQYYRRCGDGGGARFFGNDGISSIIIKFVAALMAAGTGIMFQVNSEKRLLALCARVECAASDCGCGCVEKKCEDSGCIHKMDCEEELIRKANACLQKALSETKEKAVEHAEAAIIAYCEAITLMQEYINQGYCLIQDGDRLETPQYEESWCCLNDIARKRCYKVKEAIVKGQCAWTLLCRLREIIESGKQCPYTSCNPLLPLAEQALICGEERLSELKCKMENVKSEQDCLVKRFQQALVDFKEELRNEMECLPVHLKCEITTCEQEKAFMINLAYKRIITLQKRMAHTLVLTGRVPEKQRQTRC